MSSANFIEEIHPDNEEEIEIHNVFANLKKDFEGKGKNKDFFNLIIQERNRLIKTLRDYPNHIIAKKSIVLIVENIKKASNNEHFLSKNPNANKKNLNNKQEGQKVADAETGDAFKHLDLSEDVKFIKDNILWLKEETKNFKALVAEFVKTLDANLKDKEKSESSEPKEEIETTDKEKPSTTIDPSPLESNQKKDDNKSQEKEEREDDEQEDRDKDYSHLDKIDRIRQANGLDKKSVENAKEKFLNAHPNDYKSKNASLSYSQEEINEGKNEDKYRAMIREMATENEKKEG